MVKSPRKLKDWLDSFMQYTEEVETSERNRLWTGIAALSGAMRMNTKFDLGLVKIYPNQYIVLIGPSGIRKSTPLDIGREIMNLAGVPLSASKTTPEGMLLDMKEVEIEDAGNNLITVGLAKGSAAMTVYASELTVFVRYKNFDMLELLTDLYDGRTGDAKWSYKTKTQGVFTLHDVGLNLLGATTPEKFIKSMPEESISGGFTARILFVYSDKLPKPIYFPKLTENMIELKTKLIDDLALIRGIKGDFAITDKTAEKFIRWGDSWYGTNTIGDHRFNEYMNRRRPHLIKLMMAMSISRSNELILRPEDFDRALEYLEDIEYDMPKIVGGLGTSPVASLQHKVIKILQASEGRKIEVSKISYMLLDDADEDTMKKAIATLVAANVCRMYLDTPTGKNILQLREGVK